ncbi:cilia- and flagella-associated protein 206 [Nilaparvata lugens]|uniref:cilia- and flagella-associated protein 206 n=1 Tax=Nilaparvata lugens TaxID=108931 RepID=UPI000B99D2C1|nr:cilia- and flagella-associated protein 206 [Nilaparvata lugens]XP_039281398.1 cilia- and flagella-associated protein 206 [Nilaparvata lugens]
MNQNSNFHKIEYFDNFVSKVMKECSKNGCATTETLASHVVRVMMNHIDYQHEVAESATEYNNPEIKLLALCVETLCQTDSPPLLTMKLQTHLKTQLSSKHQIVMDHRNAIQKLTQPLLSELTDRHVKMSERISLEKDDIEALYHKLVITITLLSGLGNPTQKPILMSATVALSSVFPISEIVRFLSLDEEDKIKQIEDVAHIVAGIRIFNHFTHNHSEGIDDLPNILKPACTALKDAVLREIADNERRLLLLERIMHLAQTNSEDDESNCEISSNDDFILPSVDFIKDFIVTRRQMIICLRQVLQEVENSESCLQEFEKGLKQQIKELVEITSHKTCIPTEIVFPGFLELSTMWCVLQDQVIILNHFNNILNFLRPFLKDFDEEKYLQEATKKGSTEELLDKKVWNTIDSSKLHNCQVVPYMSETGLPKIEFLSCCAYKLMDSDGLLTPANLSIGVLCYNSKYYAFSSCWAAYKFDKDPEMFLADLMEVICRHPELIPLFGLQTVKIKKIKRESLPTQIEGKEDFEMQTSAPFECYYDKDYTWNVWDLKRRAIHLANIRKMQTHSTQTGASNKRTSVGVQTYEMKDVSTQTRKDNSTSMPKLYNFRFFLNGDEEYDENIIRMTSRAISE